MTQIFPPEGFVVAPSKIEGIEVYQPAAAPASQAEGTLTFTCPKCGATTAYSISDASLKCAHCGYTENIQARQIGTQAKENEFTVQTMQDASHGWGEERSELVCQNCGAQTTIPVEALTNTCAFCGSNKVIQRSAAQDALRPRFLATFKVTEPDCQGIAQKWLGSSWMTPASLANLANLKAFSAVYLPYWTFDAATQAKWRAEVGHTVSEQYYDPGDKTWKTRTRIDWRWESGQAGVDFDDLLVPGTAKLSTLHLKNIGNFDLHQLVNYEPRLLAGMQAQGYDLPLEPAWEVARQEMREQSREACRGQASTSMIRNFSMSLDFADEVWRYILLPVFLAAYSYDNKVYQVLVNGQNGRISGQRPVDWNKVWLAIIAILAPGVLISLAGVITIPLFGAGVIIGGVGFVLLMIGIAISIYVAIQANSLGQA